MKCHLSRPWTELPAPPWGYFLGTAILSLPPFWSDPCHLSPTLNPDGQAERVLNNAEAKFSVQFEHLLAAVGRVAGQAMAAQIDHEVEVFQGQLTDEDGHVVGNFDHVWRTETVLDR